MKEFEPKKKTKIVDKNLIAKYSYVLVLAVLLIGGISYGYTFFTENRKIASGSITTANLTINFSNRNINASNLSVPSNDQEGLSEYSKSLTITNQTAIDGKVKLTISRSSGIALTNMRYAIVVNGAIQEIDDVPASGEILTSAIMGNETIDVEIRLWPKTTYSGSDTTFVGTIEPQISYLGNTATDTTNLTGKYVNFNGNEVWQIVKTENDRLVLTRQSDYSGATSRTNSNKYNPSLSFNDNSLITSVSTDNKNVYLAKTVKINGGTGTQADPYTLTNNEFREEDKKVVAIITYKDNNNTTVGTQNVYYNETNYISQTINNSDFIGWTDETNNYELGDITNISTDITLNAVLRYRMASVIANSADTQTVVDFSKTNIQASDAGLFVFPGTINNSHPIYFYRGPVDNNNVIFGGYCWLIVRTTDTGGIKMVYNGEPEVSGSGNNITYNCGPVRSFESTEKVKISLTDSTGYYYADDYEVVSTENNSVTYRLKSKNNPITQLAVTYYTGDANIPIISENYPYTCLKKASDATCTTIYKVDSVAYQSDAYVYTSALITSIGKSEFNVLGTSMSDVGYMYNEQYRYKATAPTSGAYFGTEVEYGDFDSNGTNEYRLVSGTTSTTADSTHHYTCNLTSDTGTCTTLRYYFYYNPSQYRYIELENGDNIEDVIYKMTGNGTDAVKQKNSGYNLNVNNSTIKTMIDNWFKENLTNEINQTNTNYVNYLEDTIFCDERNFRTTTGGTLSESGWNYNGGNLTKDIDFIILGRYSSAGGWRISPALPNLTCSNETDRFSMNNNRARLDYPVGLLTSDEGLSIGAGSMFTTHFLKTGYYQYLLTPDQMSNSGARNEVLTDSGSLASNYGKNAYFVRPVISLKSDIEYENGGTGTSTNPYIIKYN